MSATGSGGRDVRVIGLIGGAHATSHFFQLVLPPLFPLLVDDLRVGYTELGALMTCFYASSGLAQTVAGFAVDRFGARRVLMAGLGLLATAFLLISLVTSYWLMVPLVVVAGIGNSVFHPADYAILTSSVRKDWLARAYGVHQLGGNVGWVAAPGATFALSALFGWHLALAVLALFGYAVLIIVALEGQTLGIGAPRPAASRAAGGTRQAPLRMLVAPAILLCFAYFVFLAIATTGFQQFLPTALTSLHGIELSAAATALTSYLVCGIAGIMLGGWLADRSGRHELILAGGLLVAAAATVAIGIVHLPFTGLLAMVGVAGFCSGLTSPSRDMMVRGATPPGSTGKVFGFVYSGLDLGSSLIPPIIGFMIDRHVPLGFFLVIALALAACIVVTGMLQRVKPGRTVLAVKPAE